MVAALVMAPCVLAIAPMTMHGPNQRVANTIFAVLWIGSTLAGWRAIRQRRYADHRRWMLRSVALAFSIVTNRVWLFAAFAVVVPEIYAGAEPDPVALDQAIGVASWLSWLVNLALVEWWLRRAARRVERARRPGELDIGIPG